MITLQELRNRVEPVPLTTVKKAPGWRELRRNGGGIVEAAVLSEGSLIEVYETGYVYYRCDDRWTTFSLQDTTLSYDFDVQEDNPGRRRVLKSSIYDDYPWVVRVMLEGEYRIINNIANSGVEKNKTAFDSTRDDCGTYGYDTRDPLTIILEKEQSEMLYQCFCMISDRQQHMLWDHVLEGKKLSEIGDEIGVTHQSVSKTIKRGIKNFRRLYRKLYK